MTDASGNAVSTAAYEPWRAPRTGSAALAGFGFAGEQVDAETGLVYLRAPVHYPLSTGVEAAARDQVD
ncbi:MAG TPA: hypothetical protein VFL91_09975 [Thermomicrobiales bacterium]|nr:hypothetical protein [Thermomicrobiales bacterium]